MRLHISFLFYFCLELWYVNFWNIKYKHVLFSCHFPEIGRKFEGYPCNRVHVLYLYVMTVCLEVRMYIYIRLKLCAFHSLYSIGIKWSGELKSQLSAGLHNIKSVWKYALYSLWNLHICNMAQETKCQYTFAFKIAIFSNSSLWNENCV